MSDVSKENKSLQAVLLPGVRVPMFEAYTDTTPDYRFSTVGGMYIILSFFGTSRQELGGSFIKSIFTHGDKFDDKQFAFFGVTFDPMDRSENRIKDRIPGIRFFHDPDRKIYEDYSLIHAADTKKGLISFAPCTFVLDPNMRIMKVFNWQNPDKHIAELIEYMDTLDSLDNADNLIPSAPVLRVPRVFEPGFCRHLISLYQKYGGETSGFVSEKRGRSFIKNDETFKRRSDYIITDQKIIDDAYHRIFHRLKPEIEKAFNFCCTRIERSIVACYDAEIGGFFRPHRDNTTKATAHRRFAVTINLNADEYEGGNLRFPEYGRAEYRAATGEAIVFSCSLLHEATPIISGLRFAFLPFLYDDEAAKVREQNNTYLDESIESYSSSYDVSDEDPASTTG